MSEPTSTILVVEDQPALRQFACRVLEGAGYHTVSAERAQQALDIVQSLRGAIDLAIIDMILPGMSGLDLAASLDREFPAISILYISGYVNSVAMECIAHRSPDCVLLKPFTSSELLSRVELLLRNQAKKPAVSERSRDRRRSGSGTGD